MTTRTLAAALLAAALSGCAANFAPVAIFEICAPPAPDADHRGLPLSCDLRCLAGG